MIQAFLAKWGTKLLAALAVIGTALGALKMYGRGKKREGASEEREKQREKADEIREKMDDVPEPDSDDVADSLRDHKF